MPTMIEVVNSPELNPPRYFRVLTNRIPEMWREIYRCMSEDYDRKEVKLDVGRTSMLRKKGVSLHLSEVQEVFPIDWTDKKNVKFFEKGGYILGKNDWIEEQVAPRRFRRLCVQYADFCRGQWHIVALNERFDDYVPFRETERFNVLQKVLDIYEI